MIKVELHRVGGTHDVTIELADCSPGRLVSYHGRQCPQCKQPIQDKDLVAKWRSDNVGVYPIHFKCIPRFWPELYDRIRERIETDSLLREMVVLELAQ